MGQINFVVNMAGQDHLSALDDKKILFQHGLNLRLTTPADRAQLIALIEEICAEKRYMQTVRFEPAPAWEAVLQAPFDPAAGRCLLLVCRGRQIKGFTRVFPDAATSPTRRIGNIGIALAKGLRNRGIGKILLASLLKRISLMPYDALRADILSTNHRSLGLFSRFGFFPIQSRRIRWPATGGWIDELIVERSVSVETERPIGSNLLDGGYATRKSTD